jgi:hypothetical protein
MLHRHHPRIGDPPDAILFDDCPRCEHHSHEPLFLDDKMIGRLWERMVAVERGSVEHYLTGAEATACKNLYHIAVFLERHTVVYPWQWPIASFGLTKRQQAGA